MRELVASAMIAALRILRDYSSLSLADFVVPVSLFSNSQRGNHRVLCLIDLTCQLAMIEGFFVAHAIRPRIFVTRFRVTLRRDCLAGRLTHLHHLALPTLFVVRALQNLHLSLCLVSFFCHETNDDSDYDSCTDAESYSKHGASVRFVILLIFFATI